ncbi:MAG: polysaccharide biosynthesis protein, partial [Clostridiales bacterium]|nr:polysaccharide biosynthesis protein [Clostridiales bacterium]
MHEKTHTTFIKQGVILAAAGLLSRTLGFFLRIPLVNILGDEGNGIYGDGYTIYNFFLILSSAGLPAALSKIVAARVAEGKRAEAQFIFNTALKFSVAVGFAGFLILALFAGKFAVLIKNPKSYYTIIALSPTILVVAVAAVYRGYFQGLKTNIPTAVSQVAEQFFNVTFSIILMLLFMKIPLPQDNPFHNDIIVLGAAGGQLGTFVGATAGLAVIYYMYRKRLPKILKSISQRASKARFSSRKAIIEIVSTSVPIIAGTAVFSISNLVDSAMVKARLIEAGFLPDVAVAMYGAYNGKFVTLTTLPVAISAALATSAIPSIAESLARNDRLAVESKINAAFRSAMVVSIPAAVGLGVLASPVYKFIFARAPDGAGMMSLGAVSVIFLALSQIATGCLQGVGEIKIPVFAAFMGVIVKIPLNYILCAMPNINVYGAVISTIACYVVSSACNVYFLSKKLGVKIDMSRSVMRPLAAAAGMGMGAYITYAA